MAIIIQNVAGNREPDIVITLQRDGVDIDLTDATVDLVIKEVLTGDVVNAGHQECTVTDAVGGVIQYAPAATDFDSAGRYIAEVIITHENGQSEILYEQILIVVREAIS